MARSDRVAVHDGSLYAEAEGEGVPVVFIHAGIANLTMWDEQVSAFVAAGFRVIRYDMRGFGRSRTETGSFSRRSDLAAVMDHFGVERAHLAGCSIGGELVVDFAVELPRRVLSLVAVCAWVSGAPFEDAPNELPRFQQIEAAEKAGEWDLVAQLDVEAWVDGFYRGAQKASPAVQSRVLAMTRANYGRDDGKADPVRLDPPAFGRLDQISVPALAVVGALDIKATALVADAIVAKVPGARKLVVARAAHLPSMEQPDLFNREVISFLKSRR